MKDLRQSPHRGLQSGTNKLPKPNQKIQVSSKGEGQSKGTVKTINPDTRSHSLHSKYRPRLLTAQGYRPDDLSGLNEISNYGNMRFSSNGWTSTKEGIVSSPMTFYNFEKIRAKEKLSNYSQGKEVKVTNHILDGEEFLRLLKETKSKKEYLPDELNKSRLSQLVQQNYWKRLQQNNRFL